MINEPQQQQKKIMTVYALFGAGLILSLVPMLSAMVISSSTLLGVLVMAYVLRTGVDEDSLLHNHLTFIIRTIWIGSLLALLTLTAASLYMLETLNNEPLLPCINELYGAATNTNVWDPLAMRNLVSGQCWDNYWRENLSVFIIGGSIAIGPVLIYFGFRYARGLGRAKNGYRLANPEAWF